MEVADAVHVDVENVSTRVASVTAVSGQLTELTAPVQGPLGLVKKLKVTVPAGTP
jgi:hypothetical protein